MRKSLLISLVLLQYATIAFAAVNDTFSHHGIQFQITKEDFSSQVYEVSAIHYDTAVIVLPDFVTHEAINYAVTGAIAWYNPENCTLRQYRKIDMSEAKHITLLLSQTSGLIAIDTLILPPNLMMFPIDFRTTDSINSMIYLMDSENLLPGIHRIWSTGTQALEDLRLSNCTSLIEADLSSYTTTFSKNSIMGAFADNPFLERMLIPNTITILNNGSFEHDIRMRYFNIPDSLTAIYGSLTAGALMDTLPLGRKVSDIHPGFAVGWYNLRHIDVDTANTHFMDDNGVLYTKNQSQLFCYPYLRDGYSYKMSPKTDTIWDASFAYGYDRAEIYDFSEYVRHIKAFADSAPLKELECSPSLKYLGRVLTFYGTSIRTITKFGENQVKVIPPMCFKIAAIDSISLPLGLTEIGYEAFCGTYNLHIIENLPKLKYLRSIGHGAFRDAWKLERLDLLNCSLVTDVPQSMCTNDSSLLYVSLPRNVQSIGDEAFKNCLSLQQIVCPAVTPIPVTPSVFDGVDKQNCVLKVLPRSLNLYKNAPVWEEFFQMDTTGFYYIETAVSDTLAGSVTDGGAYLSGEYVTITADAKPGYRFVSWDDGYLYSSRTFQVTQDESFTAIFEEIPPTFYTLTVLPNDSTMGEVTGSGSYLEGTQVTLTATPYEGFILRYWSFTDLADETILYTMPPFNATVRAFFVPRDQAIDQITTNQSPLTNKIIRDNRIFILRGDKIYTLTGQQVK
ncbi:MAG: leucine-rich repeat protein [Paludibacteraceae bacterium]|nr:leucine-rich repeat protein [Paludibacteraceae bacterium]